MASFKFFKVLLIMHWCDVRYMHVSSSASGCIGSSKATVVGSCKLLDLGLGIELWAAARAIKKS